MFKITTRFALTLLTLVLGIAVAIAFLLGSKGLPQQTGDHDRITQESQRLHIIIPNDRWEPFFFESLTEHTREVNLLNLRKIVLPNDDLEVRVWYDSLPFTLDGVILKRSGDQWSAACLHGGKYPHFQIQQKAIVAPKSGWNAVWETLIQAGILTLPDASELHCKPDALDGIGYVVETNVNRVYRTYRYSNPQLAGCDEAKQMIEIAKIIADEFKLENSKELQGNNFISNH